MADFQANIAQFEERGIAVIAASVDSSEDAKELAETLGLTFPLGYSLDFTGFAEQTGAFYEVRRSIIHATGFILKADGTVGHALYSTGPVGRLTVDDCLRITGG